MTIFTFMRHRIGKGYMKKILDDILNENEVPDGIKERLLKSAKAQLLLKDLSGLFMNNVPKTSADLIKTILPKDIHKKKEK